MTQPRKHRHADMIRRWLDDDSLEVEWKHKNGQWALLYDDAITWDEGSDYRFKPRMIKCGDLEFPEPMQTEPAIGDCYWTPLINGYPITADRVTWDGGCYDARAFSRRICHTTQAAAEAHARALIALTDVK